jgi:hypothetical protein
MSKAGKSSRLTIKAKYLSFCDKNNLTNDIDWFIRCAMNANEISLKVNSLLSQIQKISTFLRVIFFASAVIFGFIGILGCGITVAGVRPSLSFYLNLSSLGHAVECWFAYKLFSCYVRGDLFSPNAVRYIRWIGIISLLMGIGNIFNAIHVQLLNGWFQHVHSSPRIVQLILYPQTVLFHLVHNLVSGFVILFIAWIMDEGRKIREEQELTV